jgi:hypothetical protein
MKTVNGTVHGRTIALDEDLGVADGQRVQVQVTAATDGNEPMSSITASALRKMPREQRQAILAAAAELAEEDYRSDKDLTGFEAFSEEDLDDDRSDPG